MMYSRSIRVRKPFSKRALAAAAVTAAFGFQLFVTGCASRMAHPDTDDNHPAPGNTDPKDQGGNSGLMAHSAVSSTNLNQNAAAVDPRMSAAGLNARLQALEDKLASMNEKLDTTRSSMDNFMVAHGGRPSGVSNSATETAGTPVGASDQPGFVQDDAVQLYRKANILFESQKYPEAMIAYSRFLEKYPDHPLAGSAQFRIGDSYFRQKQYRQAVQEFQKVLTSYDRSPQISQTLRELADSEEALGKPQEAARYRQQLTSLFANSPASQNTAASSANNEMEAAPEAASALTKATKTPVRVAGEMEPTTPMGAPAVTRPAVETLLPRNSTENRADTDVQKVEHVKTPSVDDEQSPDRPMKHEFDGPPPTAPVTEKTAE